MDNHLTCLVFMASVFKFTSAVPPDYCLMPANLSDCGSQPTAIFSFYRQGSRCEVELWRGCSTLNKFSDEYECLNHCVYHFYRFGIGQDEAFHIQTGNDDAHGGEEAPTLTQPTGWKHPTAPTTLPPLPKQCLEDLNTSLCADAEAGQTVYTYSAEKGECHKTQWYSCTPAENMFQSALECANICLGAQVNWENQLINLEDTEVEDLNDAIDDAIDEAESIPENVSHEDSNIDHEGNNGINNDNKNSSINGSSNDNDTGCNNGSKNCNNQGYTNSSNNVINEVIYNDKKNITDTGTDNGHNDIGSDSIAQSGENNNHNETNGNNNNEHNNDSNNGGHNSNDDNGGNKVTNDDQNSGNNKNNNSNDRDSDKNKNSEEEEEESAAVDSGEPAYTQVNYATTLASKLKPKFLKYSKVEHSRRLMDFLSEKNKDDY